MPLDLDQALSILGLELSSNGPVNNVSYSMPKRPLSIEFAKSSIREITYLVEVLESEGSPMSIHYRTMIEAWTLVVNAMTPQKDR